MHKLPSSDMDSFVAHCAEYRIRTVVVAWREEWGPQPGDEIAYGRVRHCRLLAYADGRILCCDLDGADRIEIAERLRGAGLLVEERCRNLA